MLCFMALGGLETWGSHLISFVVFGFLFFFVYVICTTILMIVLKMAMVPGSVAYF